MKCRNCGLINPDGVTHCKRCNTMLRAKTQTAETGGTKALVQILLLLAGTVGAVAILWVLMHNLLHAV